MANIQKITEFKAGRETLGDIHYTVYYDSGRRVNYYGRDTLPMTVVNLLTDENTVSETVYIEDNYLHCVNSRTTYTPADKPQEAAQEAPAAQAEADPITAHPVPLHLAREYDARTYINRAICQRNRLPAWGSLCNSISWRYYHSAAHAAEM